MRSRAIAPPHFSPGRDLMNASMTPDYIEQVVVTNRRRARMAREGMAGSRFMASNEVIWVMVLLDALTAWVGGVMAYRIRIQPEVRAGEGIFFPHLPWMPVLHLLLFLFIFSVYLIGAARMYGLYAGHASQSSRHEQRMCFQATMTAGLLICGTLFLLHAVYVPRSIVALGIFLTAFILMLRRAVWRKLQERRYLEGLETRNVLIVGNGRVAQALRNHLESLRHMGFRFKGFVTSTLR